MEIENLAKALGVVAGVKLTQALYWHSPTALDRLEYAANLETVASELNPEQASQGVQMGITIGSYYFNPTPQKSEC